MVSVCLPSDALSQHLPSYLDFSYLGFGVSPHGCSSNVQPLLVTLDEGYLLTAAPPDLECGVVALGSPAPLQPPLLGRGVAPLGRSPGLRRGVAPPAAAPGLRRGVALFGHAFARSLAAGALVPRGPSLSILILKSFLATIKTTCDGR